MAESEFRARFPWYGPDLQTIRNSLVRSPVRVPSANARRLELPTNDGSGDVMLAVLDRPANQSRRPLIVLIHGLTGCQDSDYILNSARFWLDREHPVLRLNLRGAGPSRSHCTEQYHAGRSDDLRFVLAALDDAILAHGAIAIGYSLGGNMLLKYLGEEGVLAPFIAAASVSAPIDLAAAAQRFNRPRNWLYQRWLLAMMKNEAGARGARLSDGEREAIAAAKTVYAFDDTFVAPRNSFAGAKDYYAKSSANGFLARIGIPTLILHARNDPWIPVRTYEESVQKLSPNTKLVLSHSGGHVGFHGRGSSVPWHDRRIAVWLDTAVSRDQLGADDTPE
ncbi:MAG: alpha/beta fold hydrolase [Alphaproteobacteria bacterium]|nr:alpha/beta fold hydrolase [Alphaproteobacteria bacterium]